MLYYEVMVGDGQFHGEGPLTYSWESHLARGQVVRVALRNRAVLGLVSKQVAKPSFAIKPITAVAPAPPVPEQSLQLLEWLREYYPAPSGIVTRLFLPPATAFSKKDPDESTTVSDKKSVPHSSGHGLTRPPLTKDQEVALAAIDKPGPYLLRGITGSGKTRVYLELADRVLNAGKSVIILTPEIGLTAPLVKQFAKLPYTHYIFHSRVTAASRRDMWFNILETKEPVVIIGPRSALFVPLDNIGLIVMDETHDQAYKSDSAPRFRTDRVAATLSRLHHALFVLGSATPNVEDMYMFLAKNLPVITMDTLALPEQSPPHIMTVDLKDRSQYGRSRIFTTSLLSEISSALSRHEQTLLFLNRRGTAAAILCESCGWRATCEYCDLPVTYHGDSHLLRCHVCGRRSAVPSNCPECEATDIVLRSVGTKAVVDELERLFPAAQIKRFDTDTSPSENIAHHLQAMQEGTVDIIVGTQMVTKGFDLSKLSLVGVLNADSSLLIPDYTANERTYQLLHQVVGRVGRGHRASTVVVQTYNPDHPVLRAAIQKKWHEFYDQEILERKTYNFPPFCYLLKLSCLRATDTSAEKAATALKNTITSTHKSVTVEGPSPSFHTKESGKYKWQLILKSSSRQALVEIISTLPSGWTHDLDPVHIL